MMRGSLNFLLLAGLIAALLVMPVAIFAQTLPQLIEGAKKEGNLTLSWGTGTMGGI